MNTKQVRWAVLGVVLVLVATVAVIVATNRGGTDSASDPVYETVTVPPPDDNTAEPTGSAPPATTSAEPTFAPPTSADADPASSAPTTAPTADASGRKPTNVPMTKLAPGEKAAAVRASSPSTASAAAPRCSEFLAAAAPNDARFTGFLTGLYVHRRRQRRRLPGAGCQPGLVRGRLRR